MLKLICALICVWSCTMAALAAPITTGQIVLQDTRKTSPCDGDPDEALKEYARKEQAEDNAFGLSFDLEAYLLEAEDTPQEDTVFLELEDSWPFDQEAQQTELEAALLALLWPEQEEDPLDFCSDT
ncbi:hypothetical protein CLU79DRAFT_715554 [Phycomyces nitens]|nr:hypothetical protein CLU79DRAFT_715554 [Phycomyces nitens]